MWTCVKCKQNVDDRLTACPYCGASRSAGRFSKEIQPQQTPQAQYTPDFEHVRAGRGFMVLGAVLAVALPVVWVILAVLRHSVWAEELCALLNPARVKGEALPFAVSYLLYGVLTLVIGLAAALPGLWTVGLGKLLRRLNRMEELL